jgi:tRNA(adenine34) deaminase
LSEAAVNRGELPFGALICGGGEVIAEAANEVVRSTDVTQHAEIVAMSAAQRKIGSTDLSGLALYSTVEPCAMCSYAIRETRIGRVVFAIRSPMMGGLSKWNVLRDTQLSRAMPEIFGPVPEVIAGLSQREAEKVWRAWNPLMWAIIKHRGYLGGHAASAGCVHLHAIPQRLGLVRRLLMRRRKNSSA